MTRVVIRGIATRKLRSLLTTLAVVLGVALISGTYILTDSIEKAFGSIFTSSYEQTDAVVSGPHGDGLSGSAAVSPALLERIRALPEVNEAAGTLIDFSNGVGPATLLDAGGDPIEGGGPTFVFGIDPQAERFNPLELVKGRWARDGEVVVDAETAAAHGFEIGDRIGVSAAGTAGSFAVVGIAKLGEVANVGGARIALLDLETAQRVHGKTGFSTIAVAAEEGVATARLVAAIRPLLPPGAQVRSGAAQAATDAEAASFVDYIRYLLLAFGAIALVVGAFVIVNTLSITVAQRTRELATLRMIGASRRQVRRTVVLEAIVLGVVASVVGVASGFLFARGLSLAFAVLDLELPEASTVLRPRTVVVALAAGIGVTTLAALLPARRATRVPPLAAVRESQTGGDYDASPWRSWVAVAFLAAAAAAVGLSAAAEGMASRGRVLLVVLASIAAFAGTALLAPRLARPLVMLLARPLAVVAGASARLARDNAVRHPARTASTAAALMIGIALATFAGVVGQAVIASAEAAIRDQVAADYIVESPGWRTTSGDVGAALASAPGIEAATSIRGIRGGAALDSGTMVGITGVDPRSASDLYRFRWRAGSAASVARLGSDGALVEAGLADAEELRVGEQLVIRTRKGAPIETTVRGIFEPPRFSSLVAQVVIPQRLLARGFAAPGSSLTLVRADEASAVERALRPFPDAVLRTPGELAEARNSDLLSVLRLLYVLLALAVLVSLLGMVNTLVLAVFERTREIGMLRAVGMTRRQVRRMVRHEGILTALLGAALGIPLGIGMAAAVIRAVDSSLIGFSLPIGTVAALAGVTVLVGVVAAALPARRASRLNVLEALQYE